jgi:hypothetical protein
MDFGMFCLAWIMGFFTIVLGFCGYKLMELSWGCEDEIIFLGAFLLFVLVPLMLIMDVNTFALAFWGVMII